MRVRTAILALAFCAVSFADTQLTVSQLSSFVRSSVQLGHQDKRVADYVRKVRLKERLDESAIEEMQGDGAGPRTLEALAELRERTKGLPLPRPAKPAVRSEIPPPTAAEQQKLIESVREYAKNYTGNLPDFLCLQITRRYYDPAGLEFWQRQDQITARLSYVDNREDYKVILVGDRPTDMSLNDVGGATSSGEFGTMLREIFEPQTRTRFRWERWGTLRGRRAHVLWYQVPKAASQWSVVWQKELSITPGYHGLIYVDHGTGQVLRITMEGELPPSFPIQHAATMLDYDYTEIGEQTFLLPLKAQVRMRHGKLLVKNEVEFRRYRKFSAEAVITFDADAEALEPLPDDGHEEAPPQ